MNVGDRPLAWRAVTAYHRNVALYHMRLAEQKPATVWPAFAPPLTLELGILLFELPQMFHLRRHQTGVFFAPIVKGRV